MALHSVSRGMIAGVLGFSLWLGAAMAVAQPSGDAKPTGETKPVDPQPATTAPSVRRPAGEYPKSYDNPGLPGVVPQDEPPGPVPPIQPLPKNNSLAPLAPLGERPFYYPSPAPIVPYPVYPYPNAWSIPRRAYRNPYAVPLYIGPGAYSIGATPYVPWTYSPSATGRNPLVDRPATSATIPNGLKSNPLPQVGEAPDLVLPDRSSSKNAPVLNPPATPKAPEQVRAPVPLEQIDSSRILAPASSSKPVTPPPDGPVDF